MKINVSTEPTAAFRAIESRMRESGKTAHLPLITRRELMVEGAKTMAAMLPPQTDVTAADVMLAGVAAEKIVVGNHIPNEGVIFYLHGGAYQLGSPATHRALPTALARATGRTVFNVDYRLAPEHPFPAALNDAVAAYMALAATSTNIVVVGDSAGGGLALAMVCAVRDRSLPMPRKLALLSPWVDLTCCQDSYAALAAIDPFMTRQSLLQAAVLYLAGEDAKNPAASPLYGELNALPPMLIQVGENEVLLDDSAVLAQKLEEAGVAVRLEVWQHMAHAWQNFPRWVPEAQQAVDAIANFMAD